MKPIEIVPHAIQRASERIGNISREKLEQEASIALTFGKPIRDGNVRFWNGIRYVFRGGRRLKTPRLITVWKCNLFQKLYYKFI